MDLEPNQMDRRRDRRIPLRARVQLMPRRADPIVTGDLLDVSARGLSARAASASSLASGAVVDVEIRVPAVGDTKRPVELRGTGVIRRVGEVVALEFTEPLAMREPFWHLAALAS